jgi:hypothetical protein
MPKCSRVIEAIKKEARQKFPGLDGMQLVLCELAFREYLKSPRQYAHTYHRPGNCICVVEQIETLHIRYIRGILWHEVGHLIAGGSEKAADFVIRKYFGHRIRYKKGLYLQYVTK